ncbi:TlpA disulfide reductase family protein [Edaphobacter sp.]|uniref:TlpA family protein disulfide reductase n=1 Tax=Edaphobacter sp. TaxID=1934404 RepID=UPI002DBDB992|nr:TlpA disulfide reductase family protein [Edaphobacter sp.]HEU5341055.1 TlpA disulfide reductase family protein [Edaphobacter sp.]
MSKFWKRVGMSAIIAVVLAACLAVVGWKLVTRRIAERMRPPRLVYQPVPASDFVFNTLDGQAEHLSALRGQVLFVNLWGTWCIQCVAEMPTVQTLYNHYRDDPHVRFLVISRLDSPATVRTWAERHRLDLPFYTMRDEDIPRSMRLNQYPATFLYGKDGQLVAVHVGAADWSAPEVVRFIDGLERR